MPDGFSPLDGWVVLMLGGGGVALVLIAWAQVVSIVMEGRKANNLWQSFIRFASIRKPAGILRYRATIQTVRRWASVMKKRSAC